MSDAGEDTLDFYRETRDRAMEAAFYGIYSNPFLGGMLRTWGLLEEHGDDDDVSGSLGEKQRAREIETDRQHWIDAIDKGGYAEGIVRIIVAVASVDRSIQGKEFDAAATILKKQKETKQIGADELRHLVTEQSRIFQTEPLLAIKTLGVLIPQKNQRKTAMNIALKIAKSDGVVCDEEKRLIKEIGVSLEQTKDRSV
jgi:tellurite resistance protein